MKTVRELQKVLDFSPSELSSSIRYFKRLDIDWDVYLPSLGKNLQRDFVWNLEQKRELINSVLVGRHIPHCAIINRINTEDERRDVHEIIDGKQRLSTIFSFLEDGFTIVLEGKEYLFSELPEDYQRAITHFNFRYYVVNEDWDKRLTDQDKISWFKFINFAGTPQDKEHINSLSKAI